MAQEEESGTAIITSKKPTSVVKVLPSNNNGSTIKTSAKNVVRPPVKPSPKKPIVNKPEVKVDPVKPNVEEVRPLIEELKQEINISDKPEQVPEKATVNFLKNDFIKEEVGKKTAKAKEPEPESSNETVSEIQDKIKKEEEQSEEQFTPEDFELFAEIIIDIIDIGFTSGLRWYAKDTSDTTYTITEKKKKTLVSQLTRILIKYQQKFSIEFMFIITILMVYATPFRAARSHRKKVMGAENAVEEAVAIDVTNEKPVKEKPAKQKKRVVKPPKPRGAQHK